MDLPVPRATVWRLLGLLLYLVGLLLSLLVVVDLFTAEGPASAGDLTSENVLALVVSIGLIMLGRGIAWKLGDADGGLASFEGTPDRDRQSTLERMGYASPESPGESPREAPDEESVVCTDCGTRNERGFTYCHNCSAELPD